MPPSWITLHPQWYVEERQLLARHYRDFRVDAGRLAAGNLVLYGELLVRGCGGTMRYPVKLAYSDTTPYEQPVIKPLEHLPEFDADGRVAQEPPVRMMDHRHQMPGGALCLFQRETRTALGGDTIRGVDALRRAERWFLGQHSGHWPPDSADSELVTHFRYVTDVLMGASFFEVKPGEYGRFYLVPDLRRVAESQVEGVYPFIATAYTVESSGVVVMKEARSDLARLYPWIEADAWDSYKLGNPEIRKKLSQSHGVEEGHWWFLPQEPKPFQDGAGLLRELSAVAVAGDAWPLLSDALKEELTLGRHHTVGLCFPSRHGGVEWLVVMLHRTDPAPDPQRGVLLPSPKAKRRAIETSEASCLRVQSLRPADLQLRNTGVVATERIAGNTVALIGLGALGGRVAELLAQAGVSRFLLCDMDRLSVGNVVRHIGGLHEFGASKVHVVANRILEINPYAEFAGQLFRSASASAQVLADFLERADLVVSTTADESVEAVINQVAVLGRKPVIYGRAVRRGSMGRAFLVRPGRDACKACLAEYARRSREGETGPADWIDIAEDEDEPVLHECGRPVIPASAVDLASIAALVARVTLDVLEGSAGEKNHWIWTRKAAPETDQRLSAALGTFIGNIPASAGCPVCREPDVAAVVVPPGLWQELLALAEASPNVETGGTLVGYVDDRRAIITRVIGPGPQSVRSAVRFERDVEYTQAELERAACELGNNGAYVGEWHTHLVADPQPSGLDIESLTGISQSPNYLTRCPVMLIAGYDRSEGRVAKVGAWAFPVGARVYEIDCQQE
jgi:integrative and conjugative element protein (TIGR02256 family)